MRKTQRKLISIKFVFELGEDPQTPLWARTPAPPPPLLTKLSMTVQINHKKLYYNYYTSGKFLTLKFKF
jgi:hypothetical protein